MVWQGNRWLRDSKDLDVTNRMTTIAGDVQREVVRIPLTEESLRKAGLSWARKCEMKNTIKNSLSLAEADPAIRASINDFDQRTPTYSPRGTPSWISGRARRGRSSRQT